MSKEFDTEEVTAENAYDKIDEFLEAAPVGSLKLIAFRAALEWRQEFFSIEEYCHVLEIIDAQGKMPQQLTEHYESRLNVESHLRLAETEFALAEHELIIRESTIPGYIKLTSYCDQLLDRAEEDYIKRGGWEDCFDPFLIELRARTAAYDDVSEMVYDKARSSKKGPGE